MIRALVWSGALIILAASALLAARTPPEAAPPPRPVVAVDGELARCRAAGEAALGDPACRRAWDATRARFFGQAPEARS